MDRIIKGGSINGYVEVSGILLRLYQRPHAIVSSVSLLKKCTLLISKTISKS